MLVMADSNNGLVVSTTDTSSERTGSTSSGNEILGGYTSNATVSRGSIVTKNSGNQGILVVEFVLTTDSTTTSGVTWGAILGSARRRASTGIATRKCSRRIIRCGHP